VVTTVHYKTVQYKTNVVTNGTCYKTVPVTKQNVTKWYGYKTVTVTKRYTLQNGMCCKTVHNEG
jgi:hypothetical protein